MTITAQNAPAAVPLYFDDRFVVAPASGTGTVINPGDWVAFSGQYIIASEDADAFWKASGLGIALDANPVYDQFGRIQINSGIVVMTRGIIRVSAAFSGQPNLGVIARPATTGSGLTAPSGVTGQGATWQTAAPSTVSGGTAANAGNGVGRVIAWYNSGLAGTGQMDVLLPGSRPDFY